MTANLLRPSLADYGRLIEARHPVTSTVLALATRSNGDRDEWIGWWVRTVDLSVTDVVATKLLARHMVVEFGTAILAGTLPGCYGGILHCPTWREGTGPCVICETPSWYQQLTGAAA